MCPASFDIWSRNANHNEEKCESKIRVTQYAMERSMLGITIGDTELRRRTGVLDAVKRIATASGTGLDTLLDERTVDGQRKF